ncbi:hypothetical protein GUJ93_ZPchr0013g35759 [Zizania palustris]|uniref:Uncharacterized protein n=1 Tax=Zizania palustris TaxID=103762 RepID=A0A8J5WXV7_ZIZPA|nr:hypothetical protein GUJ93_ZPchr0013g35759 [Zizania palustris]
MVTIASYYRLRPARPGPARPERAVRLALSVVSTLSLLSVSPLSLKPLLPVRSANRNRDPTRPEGVVTNRGPLRCLEAALLRALPLPQLLSSGSGKRAGRFCLCSRRGVRLCSCAREGGHRAELGGLARRVAASRVHGD